MTIDWDEATRVLDFWWRIGPSKWWGGDDDLDAEIKRSFGDLHARAADGALDGWAETPAGALALIILLDQFSRNIHRGTANAFAHDAKARAVASEALEHKFDKAFPAPAKQFFYLPFMHSEDMADQERCVDLNRTSGDQDTQFFALLHMDVIRRFGRFPHRNAVLGRETSAAEQAYLDSGGFSA